MAGRVCVREEGHLLRNYHHGPMSFHAFKRTSDEEGEHQHEGAPEILSANTRKKYGGLPVLGLVPAWVCCPPFFGMVARQFLGWQPYGGCLFVSLFWEVACCNAASLRPLWCFHSVKGHRRIEAHVS